VKQKVRQLWVRLLSPARLAAVTLHSQIPPTPRYLWAVFHEKHKLERVHLGMWHNTVTSHRPTLPLSFREILTPDTPVKGTCHQ
jgi:hypothetical protein